MNSREQPMDLFPNQPHMAQEFNLGEDPIQQKRVREGVFCVVEPDGNLFREGGGAPEDDGGGEACGRVEDGGDSEIERVSAGGAAVINCC